MLDAVAELVLVSDQDPPGMFNPDSNAMDMSSVATVISQPFMFIIKSFSSSILIFF